MGRPLTVIPVRSRQEDVTVLALRVFHVKQQGAAVSRTVAVPGRPAFKATGAHGPTLCGALAEARWNE